MESRTRGFRWLVALALTTAAVVGGCGGGSDEDPTDARSPTTQGTSRATSATSSEARPGPAAPQDPATVNAASPTPAAVSAAPPEVPPPARAAEMARTDEHGAVAAATHYLSLFGYGAATGDVAEWDAMSDPACLGCAGLRDEMVAVHRSGIHDPRDDLVPNAVWVGDPIDGAQIVLLGIEYDPLDVPTSADPAQAREVPVAVVILGMFHDGEGWVVVELVPGGPEYLPDTPGYPL